MNKYTDNEEEIIGAVRSLRPYEQVIITADKTGKPDSYLVVRSSKVLLQEGRVLAVK